MKRIYYFLYKTTNLINNKYYYGVHSTDNLNDGYMGSGVVLRLAFKKYGKENFNREIIKFFDSAEQMFQAERETITEEMVNSYDCYNVKPGGLGNRKGYIIVNDNGVLKQVPRNSTNLPCIYDGKSQYINSDGVIKFKSKTDPDVLSGEWVSIRKNTCVVVTPTGEIKRVSLFDPLYISGVYKGINSGKTIYITQDGKYIICTPEFAKQHNYIPFALGKCAVTDKDGNHYYVSTDDPRIKSGELYSCSTNKCHAIDKDGNHYYVSKDDPRFVNGGLTVRGTMTDRCVMVDKDGNKHTVSVDDPRIKSGELHGLTLGIAPFKDKDGNVYNISVNDQRVVSGELKGIQAGALNIYDTVTHKKLRLQPEAFTELNSKYPNRYIQSVSLIVKLENGDIFKSYVGDPRLANKVYYRWLYYMPLQYNIGVDKRIYLYENDELVTSGKYVIIDNKLNRARAPDLFSDKISDQTIFEMADEMFEKYKNPAKHFKSYPTFLPKSLEYLKTLGIQETDFTGGKGEIYWFIKNRRTEFPICPVTHMRTRYIDRGRYYATNMVSKRKKK